MARNEIFEVGQHVGMTGDGYLFGEFSGVGIITDMHKYEYSNTDECIVVELDIPCHGKAAWSLDRINEYNLYEDEVTDVITKK